MPLIVTVSRHDGRKGLDVLIAALADLRVRGIQFRACLLGVGILLEAHRPLAERMAGCARATYERRFAPEPILAVLRELYTEMGLPPATRLARTDSATYAMSSSRSAGPDGR